MELAKQIYPVQSPTKFKKEGVIQVAVNRSNAVSFENITPINEATSQRNNVNCSKNQSAQLFPKKQQF